MGKRSDFERRDRDFYPTPSVAAAPLRNHLRDVTFAEPCAGNGALVKAVQTHCASYCRWASDLEPSADSVQELQIVKRDFRDVSGEDLFQCGAAVTNPPWDFKVISDLIEQSRLEWRLPLWLLLQADFAHNKQSAPLMAFCERIVSIGRVKWIPDSPHAGKDNCAWYLFNPMPVAQTAFYARAA